MGYARTRSYNGLGADDDVQYWYVFVKDGQISASGSAHTSTEPIENLRKQYPESMGYAYTTFTSADAQRSWILNYTKKVVYPSTTTPAPAVGSGTWWSGLPTKTKVVIGAGAAVLGYFLLKGSK